MRNLGKILFIGLFGAGIWGCRDNSPAVAPVIPPDIGQDTYRREADYPKPLPNQQPGTVAPANATDNTAPPPPKDSAVTPPPNKNDATNAATKDGIPVSEEPRTPKKLPPPLPPPPPPNND